MKNLLLFLIILPGFLQAQVLKGITFGNNRGIVSKEFYDAYMGNKPNNITRFDTIQILGVQNEDDYFILSKFDTVLLFKGTDSCIHDYAYKDLNTHDNLSWANAVFYGITGDPSYWLNKEFICIKCLKDFTVKEDRKAVPRPETNATKFDAAKSKLKGTGWENFR